MGSNYLVGLLFYVHALGGVFACLFSLFFVMKMHSLRDDWVDGRWDGREGSVVFIRSSNKDFLEHE